MRILPRTLRRIAPAIAAVLLALSLTNPSTATLAASGEAASGAVSAPLLSGESGSADADETPAPLAPSAEAESDTDVPDPDEPEHLTETPSAPPADPSPDTATDSASDPSDAPELSTGVSASIPTDATKAINAVAKKHAARLGKATAPVKCGLKNSGCFRTYAHGSIHWTKSTGAHPTYGGIRNRWRDMGSENSKLGYPIESERSISTGFVQKFQHGAIHWSSATGAHSTWKAIQKAWGVHGWERGRLGYPTGEERSVKGGTTQSFQGGDIHWSSATGAHPTVGGIRTAWSKTGSETGVLGFPRTSEKCTLKNGGCFQQFTGGSIHWSSATGAHPTYGATLTEWGKHGWENGKYGFPTGSPYVTADGRMAQKFQGGILTAGIIARGLPHGVSPDGGRQLVIAHTASRSSTRGDVELWSLRDDGAWKRDHHFTQARFGYSGLATASGKREGDGKTPMGQYRIPFSFGKNTKPSGTKMEYRRVDANDQWCTRSGSKHYNQWMDAPNAQCTAKQAEALSKFAQYNYAAVIDYNSAQQANRGSAIFVHSHGNGSTAGCVSVTTDQVQTLTHWLDPKKAPRVVIAPRSELKNM